MKVFGGVVINGQFKCVMFGDKYSTYPFSRVFFNCRIFCFLLNIWKKKKTLYQHSDPEKTWNNHPYTWSFRTPIAISLFGVLRNKNNCQREKFPYTTRRKTIYIGGICWYVSRLLSLKYPTNFPCKNCCFRTFSSSIFNFNADSALRICKGKDCIRDKWYVFSGWWLNQPIWKIWVKMGFIFPK